MEERKISNCSTIRSHKQRRKGVRIHVFDGAKVNIHEQQMVLNYVNHRKDNDRIDKKKKCCKIKYDSDSSKIKCQSKVSLLKLEKTVTSIVYNHRAIMRAFEQRNRIKYHSSGQNIDFSSSNSILERSEKLQKGIEFLEKLRHIEHLRYFSKGISFSEGTKTIPRLTTFHLELFLVLYREKFEMICPAAERRKTMKRKGGLCDPKFAHLRIFMCGVAQLIILHLQEKPRLTDSQFDLASKAKEVVFELLD
eukprot:gb/GECH01000496.1/.p1 GENE.gb/GECH01000496.1/~~gb/GECH01000496.1/.p1  ORF type:complete len:250 (+),score=48.82 gb/GECH01000496.1/:1-750(+)